MSHRTLLLAAPAALLALATAASPALAKKPPKGFEATLPPQEQTAPRPADGAIFNVAAGYAPLIIGSRAHGPGDVLTIVLAESTSSSKTSQTKTSRSGSASITPPRQGPFAINPNALNASSQGSFNGEGNAAQTNAFNGTVSVTVAEARPNGTLLVKGEKRMLLSQGEEWIQFSGIVRVADINPDTNTVQSTQVADARIEYAGNGAIQRTAREGWLSKFFNIISPF